MGYDIGKTLKDTTDYDPDIKTDSEANEMIQQIINESAHVLDFRDAKKGDGISQAVGIIEKDGKPSALMLSFALDEKDDNDIVVAEHNRTTVILPIGHTFVFGMNVTRAIDNAADHIMAEAARKDPSKVYEELVKALRKEYGL